MILMICDLKKVRAKHPDYLDICKTVGVGVGA